MLLRAAPLPVSYGFEMAEDGKLTVRVKVNDGWGLTEWLLQHGDCVEIIEPQEIRENVIENLERILTKYQKQ